MRRPPCRGAGDAGHGGADAAQSDDAHATAGELQSIAAGPRPVAGLDVLIELANAADELEQKGEGVLGHGVIAIMFGVADADLQLARLIEIEVAGDAGTAEHDALDVPLPADGAQQIVRNVVAAHQQASASFRRSAMVASSDVNSSNIRTRATSWSAGNWALMGSIIESSTDGITTRGRSVRSLWVS